MSELSKELRDQAARLIEDAERLEAQERAQARPPEPLMVRNEARVVVFGTRIGPGAAVGRVNPFVQRNSGRVWQVTGDSQDYDWDGLLDLVVGRENWATVKTPTEMRWLLPSNEPEALPIERTVDTVTPLVQAQA